MHWRLQKTVQPLAQLDGAMHFDELVVIMESNKSEKGTDFDFLKFSLQISKELSISLRVVTISCVLSVDSRFLLVGCSVDM